MVVLDKDPVELGYKNYGKSRSTKKDVCVFVGFLLLMLGGALLPLVVVVLDVLSRPAGALRPDDDWFDNLVKPWWNPPDWIFGPVWTVLYVMIAASAFTVYRKIGFSQALPWMVFFVQITLNFAWPLIFFVGHQLLGSFVEIILMLVSIVFNIAVFSPVDRRAGLLLLPYLAWVTFASYLNFTLWRLNPDAATGRWCLLSDYFYLCSE